MSRHSKNNSINPKTLIIATLIVAIILIAVFVISKFKKDNNTPTGNTSQTNSTTQTEQSNTDGSQNTTQSPKIIGVENGKIYYTTQYAYVEDDNIKSVTINGEAVDTKFFIEGNTENVHIIEAIDQDDNTTTYIIYTKTIKSLTDTINTLNKYTVTADNLEDLQRIKDAVLSTGTQYSPPEETQELDNVLASCESFIDVINNVKEKVDGLVNDFENLEFLESIQNNIQKLAATITDIDELLASNNLTADQRTQLTNIRAKYHIWLSAATALEQQS